MYIFTKKTRSEIGRELNYTKLNVQTKPTCCKIGFFKQSHFGFKTIQHQNLTIIRWVTKQPNGQTWKWCSQFHIADICHDRRWFSSLFCKDYAKFWLFWPYSAIFGYFVASICTFCVFFTGLNSVVVYQNWQISGMSVHCASPYSKLTML